MKRKKRVRSHLKGTLERPRLNVFRSLKHIYAQAIVDTNGKTLVSASTLSPELKEGLGVFRECGSGEESGRTHRQKMP